MKKLLILILALVMCLSVLTSCDQVKGWIDGIIGGEEPPVTNTQADSAITLIKDDLKDWNITAADYQLNAYTHQGEVKVEWSVNVDAFYVRVTHDYENGIVYVDVNEEATTEVAYVLTAKVTDSEGNVREASFNLTLPKDRLTTYAEYAAAEAGTTVKVQGVVTGIIRKTDGWSSNSIYFQDADGGYYAYNVADADVANLAAGMTVKVVGKKDLYNGTYEIIECSVDVVDSTTAPATAVDYTEIYKNAPALDDASLVGKQSLLVTLKGVEITTQNASNGYLNFTLNGVESYLRISSSNNCVSKDVTEAIKAAHADHFGWKADVTGLVSVYNGKFYLIPATGVDAFSNFVEVEKTPAQKVESEKTTLSIETGYSVDGEYTLPVAGTNYTDVVITWASNNENVVVGANGVITVTVPDTKTEVVLTATLTCGEATATKEITITLNKTITSIADANALGAAQAHNTYTADKYLVAGVVTEIASDKYGNMYISDGTNKFYIYGLYDAAGNRYDAMTVKPVVGDYVVVLTALGQYNDAPQGKNATLVTHVAPTTIVEANTIGAAQGSDYTAEKYIVTGVVDEVYNATYGNIYIKDADGTRFYIYGLYDQAGNRYDAMTNAPKVGDTITVLTALGQYKGAPQGKNATLVAHTAGTTEEPPVENDDPTPDTELTISEAVALGASKEHNTYTEGKYYVVGTVKEVQNATYGNILIEDANGNTILVYGTYSADGKVRYDAMETRPVAGDTVKVYGIVGQYNGTAQLKNAWIIETTVNHTHDYKDVTVEATCTTAGSVTPTCACGFVDEENVKTIAPHSVSGVCSTCGTAIVNVSDLEAGTTTDAELVEGTGISASAGLTIEANGKSIDGFKFTNRLKLGGTMKVEEGVVKAGIKIVVDGPSTITVYAISGSSSATRALRLCTLTDGAFVDVMVDETVAGDAIGKYVFTVDAAGTYYLGSKSSGINLYYVSVAPVKEATAASEETFAIVANAGVLSSDSTSVSWSSENFTYVAEKGTNNNNPRVSDTDHFRIYQGNNFSITGKAGEKITKVVFTTLSASYAEVLATSLNQTAGYTATVDGSVVTVVIEGGTASVTFTTTAQTRVNNIVVTYEK